MPLNVRRFCTLVILGLVGFSANLIAQVPASSPSPTPQGIAPPVTTPIKTPTAAEIMRDRISKAKAFIAVRNYNAAIYELENIRRETGDTSVQSVTNVLLMNTYLEQGDYKRAQEFLAAAFDAQKINKPNSTAYYSTIAGQAVKGARNQIDRYRALGLMVSDRNLPLEAVRDIEQMRETLELVVTQTKEIGKDKSKADTAIALLEEATNSRGALARDDYDARRWKDEIDDSREMIVGSRSIITNAVDGTTNAVVAANIKPPVTIPASSVSTVETTPDLKPVAEPVKKPSEMLLATSERPAVPEPIKIDEPLRNRIVAGIPTVDVSKPEIVSDAAKSTGPLEVGSLIAFATKQAAPIYPSAARSMRTSGVVKVEVTVNETGDVAEVQKTSGPSLLQTAAKDAVRKWKFKPFVRDGQPVKATGFVNFNFSL